ncbi:dihydrolipoamide acetyltransferase family protein [Micromonospora inyonensis]|uniref:Dihydrolipoamide acetyltransferase component of pyruvate dehydrogenase complex n=1 Tax=Micromonospora inyonensis TaxID=47866 RepID=A0A1C6S7D5_9ACTN|nr:dihydrolipoamide acetyltransferase family protein [Micromonospora inyonensis]SCL25380.1 pyruvate dehydrogenase E2 component (dihydrolipoamide acetyltransferase) [Micromonospora inyonensis]
MIDILMPRLSDTMEEGAISIWHKQPGDPVAAGDILVDIETDKAVMEYEAYESGTLAEILVPEGQNAAIGTPIARLNDGSGDETVILTQGAHAESAVPEPADSHDATDAPTPAAAEQSPAPAPAATAVKPEHRAATPLVRKLARERGIDLISVTGTGPGGRIVRADLDAFESEPTPAPIANEPAEAGSPPPAAAGVAAPSAPDGREPTTVPFDPVRQAIARRLTESATTIPTFTVTASADLEDLLALRAQLNTALHGAGRKVTVNDLMVRAVALALREHPGVNASYSPEGRGQTLLHGRVNIGIAVTSPAGLMVPVIRDADRTSVTAISAQTRTLADKAANRTLNTADMADGTFTISNLGMYGVEHFTAIINPPQGAILAVGAATPEPTLSGTMLEARHRMRYTLTADHRIIDGALAAQFLATLTDLLEHPLRIVA